MLKEKQHIFIRLDFVLNAMIVMCSFILAIKVRGYFETGSLAIGDTYRQYIEVGYLLMILWPVLLYLNGIYSTNRFRSVKSDAVIIIRSSAEGVLLMFAIFFIFRLHIISRVAIGMFFIIVTVALILKELGITYFLYIIRKRGSNFRHILIAGTYKKAMDVALKIENRTYLGLKIAGILLPENELRNGEEKEKGVLASLGDIEKVLNEHAIDSVIILLNRGDYYKEIDNIILLCEERGIEICFVPDILNIRFSRLDTDNVLGVPLLTFNMGPKISWQFFLKNLVDRILGVLLCLASLPILAIGAIFIKITSPGPVFFKQIRCSEHGRKFTLFKLRTMHVGADKAKKGLLRANVMKGPIFKIENDPRITPIGHFLRKTSIDEVPQFWNVVKGDMSLIGPRPPIPEEVKRYKGWQRRRLSMKPGITGLWQVKGRSDITDFNKLAKLDLQYIDNWSLWLDFKIFWETIWVVLLCKGAK